MTLEDVVKHEDSSPVCAILYSYLHFV